MRNHITWTGFKNWLKKQPSTRKMICGDENRCAVADYVMDTFKPYKVEVANYDNIYMYTTKAHYEDLNAQRIKAPKIFRDFIIVFDDNGRNSAKGAKEAVKTVENRRNA